MSTEVKQGRSKGWRAAGRVPAVKALAALFLLVLMGGPLKMQVEGQTTDEYQVKAAFLFNFAKFVEWPADAFNGDGPFIIGVVGDDPFGNALDTVVGGKTVNGRKLVVRRFRWGQDLRGCHILFISPSEQNRLDKIIQSLRGASVLTVGDIERFNQHGGIIGLVLESSKVRFEINAGMAEAARIKISSKLLALAKAVRN